MWGEELKFAWRPTPRFRANANFGDLGTRIANGMKSIDVMNRTQGNPDWVLVKPWLQIASNCIVPKETLEKIVNSRSFNPNFPLAAIAPLCVDSWIGDFRPGGLLSLIYGVSYDPVTDATNQGRGFDAALGGKELLNAPHWTSS